VSISQKLLNDGETVVINTRTHPKALLAPLFWLIVALAVAAVADSYVDNSIVSIAVWVLAAAAIVWLCLRPLVIWMTASYTITSRRLITRSGVLTRRGHDIPLSRISDVAYELGLIDRMLGCGTLFVSDASTNGRVSLPDIPRVEETQRRLNQLLHEMNDPTPGHDGA
jgi:membrane protein YdbS with pleckstrin-like domain